jgi:hypothetical protein
MPAAMSKRNQRVARVTDLGDYASFQRASRQHDVRALEVSMNNNRASGVQKAHSPGDLHEPPMSNRKRRSVKNAYV